MTKFATASVVISALMLSTAGCLGNQQPVVGAVVMSALEALDTIQQQLGLSLPSAGLVSIGGIEKYPTGPGGITGKLDSWSFMFYNQSTDLVRVVSTDYAGTITDETKPSFGDMFDVGPAVPTLVVDSTAIASIAAASIPSGATGTVVTYGLSTISGAPVWTVSVATPGFAPSTFAVNGVTNATVSTSLPTIQGIPASLARGAADGLMTILAPDAFLVEVSTVELSPRDADAVFFKLEPTRGRFLPVHDLLPGDGLSAIWGLLYYNPSNSELIPVITYANLVPIVGDPVPTRAPATYYQAHRVPAGIADPSDFVNIIPYNDLGPATYLFKRMGSGQGWEVRLSVFAGSEDQASWYFDADGNLIGCRQGLTCQ